MFLGILQFYLLNLAPQGGYRVAPRLCHSEGFPKTCSLKEKGGRWPGRGQGDQELSSPGPLLPEFTQRCSP